MPVRSQHVHNMKTSEYLVTDELLTCLIWLNYGTWWLVNSQYSKSAASNNLRMIESFIISLFQIIQLMLSFHLTVISSSNCFMRELFLRNSLSMNNICKKASSVAKVFCKIWSWQWIKKTCDSDKVCRGETSWQYYFCYQCMSSYQNFTLEGNYDILLV